MDLPSSPHTKDLSGLEERLGYTFKDKGLLLAALDWRWPGAGNYEFRAETLEWLGDKLIAFITAEELMKLASKYYPEFAPIHGSLNSNNVFAEIAGQLGLRDYVLRNKGSTSKTFLADVFEAVTYAIYLDADKNIEVARKFVKETVMPMTGAAFEIALRPYPTYEGSLLRQVWEKYQTIPEYRFGAGEAKWDRSCAIEVYAKDTLLATGYGHSVSRAKTNAMLAALKELEKQQTK
ncbi:MAG: ribonuclease III family protein [DPANN group archaeon]|nr:ribonuclease III family protein [DPANN group archaeon]